MVSIGLVLGLALIIGFIAFGGIKITKTTVDKIKEKSEIIKSETQKRIDEIKSKEVS